MAITIKRPSFCGWCQNVCLVAFHFNICINIRCNRNTAKVGISRSFLLNHKQIDKILSNPPRSFDCPLLTAAQVEGGGKHPQEVDPPLRPLVLCKRLQFSPTIKLNSTLILHHSRPRPEKGQFSGRTMIHESSTTIFPAFSSLASVEFFFILMADRNTNYPISSDIFFSFTAGM